MVDRSGENPPNGDTPPERETQEPSAEPVAPDSDPASDQPANGLQPGAAPDTPYRIGKCRPPRETRFQKGPHGNRKGRRKGSVNLAGLLLKALRRRISVTVGGRPQSMSAQDALIEVTLKRALGGDLRAFNMILRILSEAKMWPEQGDSSRAPTHSTEISAENQAIIDDFVQRFKGG